MANKNNHDGRRHRDSGQTNPASRTATPKRKPTAMHHAAGPQRNSKKPLLYLIGFGGLAVGTAIWLWPTDQTVDVQRTRYASRDACLQDWNNPTDCEFVADTNGAANAEAASGASAASGSASASGGSSGAGHGTGGHWGGGQPAGMGSASDVAGKKDGGTTDSAGITDPAATTDTTKNANNSEGAKSSTTESGWYGPYYTRDGVVYHASGLHTTGVPVQHGKVSSLTVRESALSGGSTAFGSTPRSVSLSEGRAISRGGFLSGRGGSGGESGGHGGGEGGGHGGGGGHGSGGG